MPVDRLYLGAESRMSFKMISSRSFHPIVAATLCGLCLVFFGASGDARSAEGVLVDRIVAQVNDDIITLYDLNRKAAPFIKRVQAMARPLDEERQMIYELRDKVLNQMVDEKLTDQEIRRFNIQVSEEAIDKTIEEMKKRTYMTDQQLRDSLKKEGLTMDEYRTQMKNQILRVRLVNREVKSKIVITEEDIRAFYEENRAQYVGEGRIHLRQIMMVVSPQADEEEKQALREKMSLFRSQVMDGTPFEALAREYSESKYEGDLGTFTVTDLEMLPLTDLAPQVLNAVSGLKAGDVTEIVEIGQSMLVFYVEALEEGKGKTLEEVSADIENILYDQIVNLKFMTWLTDLRERSHIKIIR
jgi:peptidyl-prolyl cis-trans isomerase SurA